MSHMKEQKIVSLVIIPLTVEKIDEPFHHATPSADVTLAVRDGAALDLGVLSPQTLEHGLRQSQAGWDVQGRFVERRRRRATTTTTTTSSSSSSSSSNLRNLQRYIPSAAVTVRDAQLAGAGEQDSDHVHGRVFEDLERVRGRGLGEDGGGVGFDLTS